MKKQMLLTLALGAGIVALAASTASAGTTPGSGIRQSRHDLSSMGGWSGTVTSAANPNDSLDRICIYCHAPHKTQAVSNNIYTPLWNRPKSGNTTKFYSNGLVLGGGDGMGKHASQAASLLTTSQTMGISNLCLSCHDGSVALNVYGNTNMGSTESYSGGGFTVTSGGTNIIDDGYKIGANGDLSNHHPVGFDYTAVAAADNEIAPISNTFINNTAINIEAVLEGGQYMQCSSCHDVHNSTANMGEKFLWTSNTQSNLCCSCHLKCSTGAGNAF